MGGSWQAPDPPCSLPSLTAPLTWPLSGPMPWRPGTTPISSTAAMIHSPVPSAQYSALGTLWLLLEGPLRTWHCWWVCGGQVSGRTQGEGPEPLCQRSSDMPCAGRCHRYPCPLGLQPGCWGLCLPAPLLLPAAGAELQLQVPLP